MAETARAGVDTFLEAAGFASAGGLKLAPAVGIVREVLGGEHAVVATISTQTQDRYGDVLVAGGVRLERYRANPVVLYAHDYSGLPVAESLWERVEGDAVVASPRFHLDTELSRETWALVEKGILSAWSVGFLPEEWERTEKEELDDGIFVPASFRVTRWDLLEYSAVPVPANFEALTNALKGARISAPCLVKSLEGLGLVAPDLVPQRVKTAPEKVPAAEEEAVMPEKQLASLTAEQLEAERPDLVGQLKAAGQEEEAARAAAEKATADAERAEAEAAEKRTAEEKAEAALKKAADDAAKAERERFEALKALAPEDAAFAVEHFEKGLTVKEAEDALKDRRIQLLEKEVRALKSRSGVEPVGTAGDPDAPKDARAIVDELQAADPKISRTKALSLAHRKLKDEGR